MTTKIDGTAGITFPDNSIRGSGSLVAGVFKKLAASASGLSALIPITADAVALENASTFSPIIVRSVNLTIDSSTVGLNGLDTGTLAASTWYYKWIISDGINVRGVLSLSATAPNVSAFPTYVYAARIGAIRTDGTANKYPLGYKQFGRRVQYLVAAGGNLTVLPTIASGGGSSSPSVGNFVPPTAGEIWLQLIGNLAQNTGAGAAPSSAYSTGGSGANAPLSFYNANVSGIQANAFGLLVLESSTIYYSSNSANAVLQAQGWIDNI